VNLAHINVKQNSNLPNCLDKIQFRIAVSGRAMANQSSDFYCMTNSGQLSIDRYVHLTPCSTITSNDRTALWSWEGPYLLRHTQSSYCL